MKLPLIKNKKTVNPRDGSTTPVFQLETAMGSAIENFDDAAAIVVPRSRFAPVKTCNDLFTLRSDAYKVHMRMTVCVSERCMRYQVASNEQLTQLTAASTIELAIAAPPVVKLDDKHYKLVDKMEALTTAAPSLAQASKLTVKGPVIFGPGTVIKGEVTVVNGASGAV